MEFVGVLKSNYGITLVCDATYSEGSLPVSKIDKNSIVSIHGNDQIETFLEEYIIPREPKTLDDVITLVSNVSDDNSTNHDYDFTFLAYSLIQNRYQCCLFHAQKNAIRHTNINMPTHFLFTDELARYVINSVYSEHMSAQEVQNMMFYITLQHVNIFNISPMFDAMTISAEKTNRLTADEIQNELLQQNKIDRNLKKVFSNFFVSEAIQ